MRRRSTSPLVMAACLIGAALASYGELRGLVVLIEPDPLPELEQITYLDLTPEPGDPLPEPPRPEEKKDETKEPDKLEEPADKEKPPELPEALDEPEPDPPPEPEPEPELVEELVPEPEEPPPPFEFILDQLKMVEQPDELDEDQAPDDVEYLSNINRDVAEQTRAEVTNLQEDSIKTEAKELEPTETQDKGTADEDVIAEDAQKESQLAKQAPDVRPEEKDLRPEQKDTDAQALQLAMRELEARDHHAAAEAHEALADEAPDGALRPEAEHEASIAEQDQQARIDRKDERYAFKLSHKDLDALYGESIDAPRRDAAKEQSKKKGIWDDAAEHWQSPLENMIPEVQVGNQTALRSRKHPFARYITKIHREIHDAWAWGFLEQLDTRGRRHELNDYELWTRVEMVLTGDGKIERVITVHHSGSLVFDAAAREIVYAIGPFPDPPREILSGNGKVYIHWAFHRDERACGTFGAQPFILDNAGVGDVPDPDVEVRPGEGGAGQPVRRLSRRPTSGVQRGSGPVAPAVPHGPAPPSGTTKVPHGDHGDHAGHDHGGAAPLPPPKPTPQPSPAEQAADPAAAKAANDWLAHLVAGDVDKLAARSTLPFYSGSTIVARTKEERRDILEAMSQETRAGKGKPTVTKPKIHTAASLRQIFGSVPAGVEEGTGQVYALTKVRGDYVVLMLEKKFGAWRVVGTTR